jgi:hypothetical protein
MVGREARTPCHSGSDIRSDWCCGRAPFAGYPPELILELSPTGGDSGSRVHEARRTAPVDTGAKTCLASGSGGPLDGPKQPHAQVDVVCWRHRSSLTLARF